MIGCGNISRSHVQAASSVSGVEFTAASSRNASAVAEISAEYGIEHQFSDWRDLVASDFVDAVVICLPDGLHEQATVEAAKHGKHVLVEKPMGNNLGQSKTMVAAADQAGVVLMVAQLVRQFNSHQLAKRMIQDGKIGSVSRAIRRRHYPLSITREAAGSLPPWQGDPNLCTDPLLFGLGTHEYDALLWLFESEAAVVVAQGKKGQAIWPGWWSIEGSVGLRNGVEVAVSLSLQADEEAWDTRIEGAKGTMTIYFDRLVVDGEEIECQNNDTAFAAQLNEFADCVRGERDPGPSGRNVLATMALLDGVIESIQDGSSVEVEEIGVRWQ